MNALDMDGYCKTLLMNILQLVVEYKNTCIAEKDSANGLSHTGSVSRETEPDRNGEEDV